jgi:hypothetical protein
MPSNWEARFFLKLAPCSLEWVFIRSELSLRDRPGAKILLGPVWTTGMDQEDFENSSPVTVHQ